MPRLSLWVSLRRGGGGGEGEEGEVRRRRGSIKRRRREEKDEAEKDDWVGHILWLPFKSFICVSGSRDLALPLSSNQGQRFQQGKQVVALIHLHE